MHTRRHRANGTRWQLTHLLRMPVHQRTDHYMPRRYYLAMDTGSVSITASPLGLGAIVPVYSSGVGPHPSGITHAAFLASRPDVYNTSGLAQLCTGPAQSARCGKSSVAMGAILLPLSVQAAVLDLDTFLSDSTGRGSAQDGKGSDASGWPGLFVTGYSSADFSGPGTKLLVTHITSHRKEIVPSHAGHHAAMLLAKEGDRMDLLPDSAYAGVREHARHVTCLAKGSMSRVFRALASQDVFHSGRVDGQGDGWDSVPAAEALAAAAEADDDPLALQSTCVFLLADQVYAVTVTDAQPSILQRISVRLGRVWTLGIVITLLVGFATITPLLMQYRTRLKVAADHAKTKGVSDTLAFAAAQMRNKMHATVAAVQLLRIDAESIREGSPFAPLVQDHRVRRRLDNIMRDVDGVEASLSAVNK